MPVDAIILLAVISPAVEVRSAYVNLVTEARHVASARKAFIAPKATSASNATVIPLELNCVISREGLAFAKVNLGAVTVNNV